MNTNTNAPATKTPVLSKINHNIVFVFICMLLFFMVPGPVITASTQVSISASDNLADIGDQIHLKIIVKTTSDVDGIKVKTSEKAFEILHQDTTQKRKQQDYMVFEKTVRIAFFKTGDFNIGPFEIDLVKGEEVLETRETNSIPVTIKSVLKEEDKDIRPLKELSEVAVNPWYFLMILFGVLLVVILGVTVYMLIKHYRNRPKTVSAPSLSPLDELEAAVKDLNAKRLIEKGKPKIHFIQLTQILKRFLHRVYGFGAEDFTTYETMAELKKAESAEVILNNLQFLFNTSDLVKFAKFIPDANVMGEVSHKTEELIFFYIQRRSDQERKEEEVSK